MMEVPIIWREEHLTGDENALTASLGEPNMDPPNFPPDNIITYLILGTFVSATPSNCIPGNAADIIAPYNH